MATEDLLDASFKTKPYSHQICEFEQYCNEKARALLWVPRTGKSKAIIDLACHLWNKEEIDAVLLVAPNGVHANWLRRELVTHSWQDIKHAKVEWVSSIAGKTGLSVNPRKYKDFWNRVMTLIKDEDPRRRLKWFAFNSEALINDGPRTLIKFIIQSKLRVMLVVDESHQYRAPGAKRTKMIRAISKKCKYKRILTGTVVTNTPFAAFSQFEILEPGALGFDTFHAFKDHYGTMNQYTYKVDYKNLDELRDSMARWSSVITKDDCPDLPPVVQSNRSITMTEEQTRIYNKLVKQYLVDIKGRDVSIGELTAKFIKLQQVSSGFLIDEYKEEHDIPGRNPRLEAAVEECSLAPEKMIVWCMYKREIAMLTEALKAEKIEFMEYHGNIKREQRQKVLDAFAPNADNEVKVLVAQPQAGGTGINLSAAHNMMWYSHGYDAIVRLQALERATQIGGRNIQVINLIASPLDREILASIDRKVSIADNLSGTKLRKLIESLAIK